MNQEALVDKEINLQNDVMFKSLMTNPNCREMVSNVISELTGIDKGLLLKASYIVETTNVTVTINEKQKIILAMNQYKTDNIFEKNTMYLMNLIVENIKSGKDKVYPEFILINIDNFNYYKTDKPILVFQARDKEGNVEMNSFKSIHIILENFKESTHNVGEETKKFARFLQEKKTVSELANEYKEDEEYMSVIQAIEELSSDSKFAECYAIEEKHRQQLESAKETGIDEGIQEGEHNAKISTAKKMLEKGISIEDIVDCTELSLEEIKKLKD